MQTSFDNARSSDSPPLVTIGMPVYNGLPDLHEALATLTAQDYPNVELLISDNCSTDGTAEICRELQQRRPGVGYWQNPRNIGPLNNFLLVLERARGKYFMWAAHDDRWSPQFVSSLVERLEAEPDAVLATPLTTYINVDGRAYGEPIDHPTPPGTHVEKLRSFFADHASSWIYGVYRTDWLRRHRHELAGYPLWGGDVIWIADVCMRFNVVGTDGAILYKRMRKSRLAPKNAREQVWLWAYMFWYLGRSAWRNSRSNQERWKALGLACEYVYRLYIRRPNVPRTMWRVVRMLLFGAIELPVFAVRKFAKATSARLSGRPQNSDQSVDLQEIVVEMESQEAARTKAA
jgi:glycosyltransferase involved in cell wall biosynthesis